MGGCADREDKFGKKKNFSFFHPSQDFETDEKTKTSTKPNEKSHSFEHQIEKILSKQSKTQGNEPEEEFSETKQGPGKKKLKFQEKSLSLTFSIDRQINPEVFLISPTSRKTKNSLNHCESLSIINKKAEKKAFFDSQIGLTIPASPNSCFHEKNSKKTLKVLDRCSDLTIRPPELKKRMKIVEVSQEFCRPVKHQKSAELFINYESRPGSPEPENSLIFLSCHKFISLDLKPLNRLPEQPVVDSLKPLNRLPEQPVVDSIKREKVIRSLSSQTTQFNKISKKLRKSSIKESSTDLPTPEILNNPSQSPENTLKTSKSQSSEKVLIRQLSDLMTPQSPSTPLLDSFSSERLYLSEIQKPSNLDSLDNIEWSTYRKATENREYFRRDSLQQVIEIPEEFSKNPEFHQLSSKISELKLQEVKNKGTLKKTRFFRRVTTQKNF
jgi:hypothetical protein